MAFSFRLKPNKPFKLLNGSYLINKGSQSSHLVILNAEESAKLQSEEIAKTEDLSREQQAKK